MSAGKLGSTFRHFYERLGSAGSETSSESAAGLIDDTELQPAKQESVPASEYKRYIIPWLILALGALVVFLTRGILYDKKGEVVHLASWRLDTHKNYTIDSAVWRSEDEARERHYYMEVSKLVEVSPDGIKRNLTVINGQYPGPLLEANAGDTLNIHVTNLMKDDSTTIHCHGLLFNKNQNFYDGSSSINQCPIGPGKEFTYKIHLDENQWGTYWYHSHYGAQYADGVFGPLVIHSKKEDELLGEASRYDAEVVVVVNDYYHDDANEYLEEYLAPGNENDEPSPDAGLIQGGNVFDYNSATYLVPNNINTEDTDIYDPTQSFYPFIQLDKTKVYRIRLINAGFFVPFSFSIDEHNMSIIETDGSNVVPVVVQRIDLSVSQRYSFILQRQAESKNLYWTRAYFNGFCLAESNPNFNQQVKAVLSYSDAHERTQISDSEVNSVSWEYNGGDTRCRDTNQNVFRSSNEKVPRLANGTNAPDRLVELDVAFLIKGMQLARGYFNDMTWTPLPDNENTLATLRIPNEASALRQANELESKSNNQFLLNFDRRGEIVDILINNYDDGAHPFHMHGYKFWVIGDSEKGYFKKSYYDNDEDGVMNFSDAVKRDTINVSGYGWAVIRIVIDNPGVWPFHCHIGWHMESGLLLQVNALQNEYSAWNHYPEEWANLCNA
ncbi:unnamed protein product [Kluyveromyces dobzhanskii CBS 2104]|uniref:WGS project CCBQ000000000 data, contig 00272 n=1 Tax=Kluyveromyces dobzhanskii CBS 2104 TaxID=1427455 RepID=A0A0A8LAH6_9SACH|nr:unnamed protein product [Kluyveromyces dobzhanskii CBS 2104]